MLKVIRLSSKIETGDKGYSASIMSDKADEIKDAYVEVLLDWAKSVWDWEAVVTEAENRAEKLEISDDLISMDLSREDLIGLFGGKYGGSPGAIPGFLDANGKIADEWADIQAWVWVPVGRFQDEVIAELRGKGKA